MWFSVVLVVKRHCKHLDELEGDAISGYLFRCARARENDMEASVREREKVGVEKTFLSLSLF